MSKEKNRKNGSNHRNTAVNRAAAYVGPLALLVLTQNSGTSASVPNASAMVRNWPQPKTETLCEFQPPHTGTVLASALPANPPTYSLILVPSYPARTIWYQEGLEKIDAMRDIAPNWDTYGAAPPTEAALTKAKTVMETLHSMNLRPSRIAASAEGGVAISFFDENRYSDIEMLNTDDVLAATSVGDGSPHVWEVSPEDLKFVKTMETIRGFIRAK